MSKKEYIDFFNFDWPFSGEDEVFQKCINLDEVKIEKENENNTIKRKML